MPRLVARQWPTLRGAHTAIRTLCRSQQYTRSAVSAAVRSYAQQSTSDSKPFPAIRPLNSAILIPSSVKNARPEDLINYINPIPHEHLATDTFCVFLVTPSFAPWLLKDGDFLSKAVRRAYSKAFTGKPGRLTIHALSAVVDRLPIGRAIKVGTTIDDEVVRRSTEPPVSDAGFEGIAFATLPATASVPSMSPRASQNGAIDFIISGKIAHGNSYSETWRLPLANTVFQTGTPTTMSLSKWGLLCDKKFLGLEEKTDVSHHGVRITGSVQFPDQTISALSIPLVPLTLPRQVDGCMGNIIRRVIGPDNKTITASSELEHVVPLFFKSRGESAQPTTAWALVIPKALKTTLQGRTTRLLQKRLSNKEKGLKRWDVLWERLWQSDPPAWNKLVPDALAEGARLHRVLSGGGGWGKKAGLLSLDPVPISEEIPIRMEDATSSFDGPGDFSTALMPVVHDGDAIQFFISPSSGTIAVTGEPNELEKLKSLPKERAWGWELGTIPSTVDSIPGGSWQHNSLDSNYVAVFRHSFGALAEGGLTLTRRIQVEHEEPFSLVGTTTVDVPFSRFWTVDVANKYGSSKDPMNNWQTKTGELLRGFVKRRVRYPQENIALSKTERPAQMPIRRIVARRSVESSGAANRLTRISDDVTDLTNQYRVVMHALRKRQRLVKRITAAQIVSKRYHQKLHTYQLSLDGLMRNFIVSDPLHGTLYKQIADGRREPLPETADVVSPWLAQKEVFSVRKVFAEENISRIILRDRKRRQRVLKELLSKADSAALRTGLLVNSLREEVQGIRRNITIDNRYQTVLNAVHHDLERFLKSGYQPRRISHAANVLATNTYGLDVALRLQIGRMIFKRQKEGNKLGVRLLEKHLIILRTYNQILMFDKPGMTRLQVKEELKDMELRSPVQRALAINTEQATRQRDRRLKTERARSLRQALKGRTISVATDAVVRKTFDRPASASRTGTPVRTISLEYGRTSPDPRQARHFGPNNPENSRTMVHRNGFRKHVMVALTERRAGSRSTCELRNVNFAQLRNSSAGEAKPQIRTLPSKRRVVLQKERVMRREQLAAMVGSWLGGGADAGAAQAKNGRVNAGAELFGGSSQRER